MPAEVATVDPGLKVPDAPETVAPLDDEQQIAPDLGEWNERLDPRLQECLKRLAQSFCDEFRYPRRLEVMAAWRARMFWREIQHLNWNWENETWEALGPTGTKSGTQAEKYDSAVLYSTNIYQGFGDSYIAIMTQNVPSLRFEPEDPEEPADIETANASDSMRKIVQHENDPIRLLVKASYYSWTEGRIHGRSYWAKDKRTGKERETQCVEGVMECKVPILADTQDEFLYFQYSKEYRIETVRAKVKERAFDDPLYWKKIKPGSTGNGQDTYERTARISAKQGISMRSAGGDAYGQLCTTQLTWMRPEAFMSDEIQDTERDELSELFPNGAMVEFDNGTYTGSKNANMDDEWAVENIMEGDGQFRNGKGTCLISIQERGNDIINAAQDVYEKTLPASHWDQKLFDVDAMRRQRSSPGARYPVDMTKLQAGDTIGAHLFFEPAAQVSADMLQYLKELMTDLPQFLTGISAILFGADQTGDKSGKALSVQQNMAMGRIGLPWSVLKRFYARMMEQAVRLAARKRADQDVSIGVRDENGQIEKVMVRAGEMSGKVRCYADADQGYPESWTNKRNTYLQLMQEGNADPTMKSILSLPRNQQLGKKLIGLQELEIPGADSWNKQMEEIKQLLAEQPSVVEMPTSVPNPLTQEPEVVKQQKPVPSLGIDAEWDDNQAEYITIKIWVNSAAGRKAKKENKPGFDNVRLHGELHRMAMSGAVPGPGPGLTGATPTPGAPPPKPAAPAAAGPIAA